MYIDFSGMYYVQYSFIKLLIFSFQGLLSMTLFYRESSDRVRRLETPTVLKTV